MTQQGSSSLPRLRANLADFESTPLGEIVLRSCETPRVDKGSEKEQVDAIIAIGKALPGQRGDMLGHLFPYLRHFNALATKAKARVIDVLCAAVAKASSSGDEVDAWGRDDYKTLVYFLANLVANNERNEIEQGDAKLLGGSKAKATKAGTKASAAKSSAALEDGDDFDDDAPKASKKGKVSSTDGLDWGLYRERVLSTLVDSLGKVKAPIEGQSAPNIEWVDLSRIFPSGVPDEDFLSLFWQLGELLLERTGSTFLRSGSTARMLTCQLLSMPTGRYYETVGHNVASSLSTLVREKEAAGPLVCEILMFMNEPRLARELVLELTQIQTSSAGELEEGENAVSSSPVTMASTSTTKNVSKFLEDLASRLPALMLSNLSVLLPHLNGESYQMRCSIIRIMGCLVEHLKDQPTSHAGAIKTRDKLLDVLAQRTHDVSSFGRGAALQAWTQVVESGALPLDHVDLCCELACERVADKSALVRKAAFSLLKSMIEHNPYSDNLTSAEFVGKIAEAQSWLEEQGFEADGAVKVEDGGENPDNYHPDSEKTWLGEDEQEDKENDPDATLAEIAQGELADEAEDEEEDPAVKVFNAKVAFLKYCKSALMFIARLEHMCSGIMCAMLTSKTTTDVQGALRFFATAHEFGLVGAKLGVRRMLRLIWDVREGGAVKRELIETFERLYVARETSDDKRVGFPPMKIATSLVDLARESDLDQLVSLEQIVAEVMRGSETAVLKRRVLPSSAIDALWHLAETTDLRVPALSVLSMAASTSPSVVDRAPLSGKLIQCGFRAKSLPSARWAFVALTRATEARGGHCGLSGADKQIVLEAATSVACGKWEGSDSPEWFPAAEAAIHAVCALASGAAGEAPVERALQSCVQRSMAECAAKPTDANCLARLFFLSGTVAVKILALGEALVSKAKRARASKGGSKPAGAAPGGGEEDMLGASAEEEGEELLMRRLAEVELVGDNEASLLGSLVPLAVRVSTDPNASETLRESAVLALCKFMCVSEAVCEKHLSLVLTILRDAPEARVRANIVIALGDLAFRYPNAVEPYTAQVYRPLRDPVVSVRKNTLMVLTHLVLNDMLKVRGEVAEIALRLEDPDERVADLAKMFFTELSKRGNNPIYNLLPDVLGTLSRDNNNLVNSSEAERARASSSFKTIAKFLLDFVEKDRQCEAIVDKLCHRIHAACGHAGEGDVVVPSRLPEIHQVRDLAFCVEHVRPNEASTKRINGDLFKCVRPVLGDSVVAAAFAKIAAKAKSTAKSADAKRVADELIEKIETNSRALAEDVSAMDKAFGRTGGKVTKKPQKQLASQGEPEAKVASENLSSAQLNKQPTKSSAKTAKAAPTKTRATSKRRARNDDDEEDQEMELAE